MGLFQMIFGKKEQPRPSGGIWQTLTGYTPAFTSWSGQLYESALIRAAIDAIAREVSKLEVQVNGTARMKLRNAIRSGPNQWQTWGQFLYRTATILYVKNTAFIVPVEDEFGGLVGYATILPSSVQTVQDERGTPWLRFEFADGHRTALPLAEVGILTRHQYKDDLFGDGNKALAPTMAMITMQEQGIPEAIKNSATFRFMARLSNFAKAEDLRKERDRFNAEQMGSGSGGVLLFPNTWDSLQQIQMKPYTVDADQMELIQKQVYNYFGVNEDVIQSKAVGDAWNAFYEGCISWLSVQLSDVLTRMTYSDRERSAGNEIVLASNRLQYMSAKDKLEFTKSMTDRGIVFIDEIRALWNLPPLPDGLGQKLPARGEYKDMAHPDEAGPAPDEDKEVQEDEQSDPA